MTTETTAALCAAFGKVAEALAALENDEQRKRVIAAVICLFDDDHGFALSVVDQYARGGYAR